MIAVAERRAPVVVARGVHKRYRRVVALAGVDVSVAREEVIGLLGPNGAGKTTLMEILTGLRRADAGTIEILGLNPVRDRARLLERVGVQTQEFAVQPTVTVLEALRFFASLYPHPRDPRQVAEELALTDKLHARFVSLSGGQKKRLSLGKALIGNPELLVLDEPTSGVDPQGRAFLRERIRQLRLHGRTTVLATHDIHDAQNLCDRVLIIDRGAVVAEGSPDELIRRHAGPGFVRLETPGTLPRYAWPALPGVQAVQSLGQTVILYCQEPSLVVETLKREAVHDGSANVTTGRATLEDVFLILTGRSLRE